MSKFLIFTFPFLLLVSGAKRSFQDGEKFNGTKISMAFYSYISDQHGYLSYQHRINLEALENLAIDSYEMYPVECLEYVDQHQDWIFKTVFWELINDQYACIAPSDFSIAICKMFNNISSQIQTKLLKTYSCREEKEKQFTAMKIMVNMIKKNWDQVGSEYYFLIQEIKWNLPIWEFLFDNLLYRYEKNTIDYESLTNTYSRMEELVAANPKDVCFNDELGNLCALFATYLAIMGFQGDHGILDLPDQRKIPIIYLIQEMNWGTLIYEEPAKMEAQKVFEFYKPFADAHFCGGLIGGLLYHLLKMNERGVIPSYANLCRKPKRSN